MARSPPLLLLLLLGAKTAKSDGGPRVAVLSSGGFAVTTSSGDGRPTRVRMVNHVNDGGGDDGVGGREAALCRAEFPGACKGDGLSFAPSLGVSPYGESARARHADCGGDEAAAECWARNATAQLASFGFNSAGGWSARAVEENMDYVHLLQLASTWSDHADAWMQRDFFSSGWIDDVKSRARAQIVPRLDDTHAIGWWTDNEIAFGGGTSADGIAFLDAYLCTLPDGPGRRALRQMLARLYNDSSMRAVASAWGVAAPVAPLARRRKLQHDAVAAGNVDEGWRKQICRAIARLSQAGAPSLPHGGMQSLLHASRRWMEAVAWQYHNVTAMAIRAVDNRRLMFGVRFAGVVPRAAIESAAAFNDVVDVHLYASLPDARLLQHIHRSTQRPLIVGEFSFAARDAGLPGTRGAWHGASLRTQTDRARAAAAFVRTLREDFPFCVGYAWWQYADEPPTGRWPDFECMNYGLTTLTGEPYRELTDAFAHENAAWRAEEEAFVVREVLPLANGTRTMATRAFASPAHAAADDTTYAHCVEDLADLTLGTFATGLCTLATGLMNDGKKNTSSSTKAEALRLLPLLTAGFGEHAANATACGASYIASGVWGALPEAQAPLCCDRLSRWIRGPCASTPAGSAYEQALGLYLWPGSYDVTPLPYSRAASGPSSVGARADFGAQVLTRLSDGSLRHQPSWRSLDASDADLRGRWAAAAALVGAACSQQAGRP